MACKIATWLIIYTTKVNVAHPIRNKILNNAYCTLPTIAKYRLKSTQKYHINCKWKTVNRMTVNNNPRYL